MSPCILLMFVMSIQRRNERRHVRSPGEEAAHQLAAKRPALGDLTNRLATPSSQPSIPVSDTSYGENTCTSYAASIGNSPVPPSPATTLALQGREEGGGRGEGREGGSQLRLLAHRAGTPRDAGRAWHGVAVSASDLRQGWALRERTRSRSGAEQARRRMIAGSAAMGFPTTPRRTALQRQPSPLRVSRCCAI
jgi:hypothetical protein